MEICRGRIYENEQSKNVLVLFSKTNLFLIPLIKDKILENLYFKVGSDYY